MTAIPSSETTSPARPTFYSVMAILGTLMPWYFFEQFILQNGIDLVAFVEALFINGASSGLTSDILISATVFWVWSFHDARAGSVRGWWMVIPATLLVGLSLALPLYLLLRSSKSAR